MERCSSSHAVIAPQMVPAKCVPHHVVRAAELRYTAQSAIWSAPQTRTVPLVHTTHLATVAFIAFAILLVEVATAQIIQLIHNYLA